MAKYVIECYYTTHCTVEVEADSIEDAKEMAWEKAGRSQYDKEISGNCVHDFQEIISEEPDEHVYPYNYNGYVIHAPFIENGVWYADICQWCGDVRFYGKICKYVEGNTEAEAFETAKREIDSFDEPYWRSV